MGTAGDDHGHLISQFIERLLTPHGDGWLEECDTALAKDALLTPHGDGWPAVFVFSLQLCKLLTPHGDGWLAGEPFQVAR